MGPERMGDIATIDSEQWRQTVIRGALVWGVAVSDAQARIMGRHALELLHWNRTTNLTAITDPLAVAVKHYVDAVAVVPWIHRGARILDAGSGGGFPGIPLNILRPDLSVTLVDSVRKKVSFLKYAIRTLNLNGITAVHGRLEDLGPSPPYRGSYDLVVCRAFSSLEDFAGRTLPFLSPGGSLLAMKGPQSDPDQENENHKDDGPIVLGGTSFSVRRHRYRLPFLDAQRSLVRLTPVSGA
ncbi:ribosomal RNA small subunit methyltransferase G [Desulfosarcina alkanivorans]|uniref:Ribosomal RNA small subunit methyltransferase G n=1 Tax=Desulfosarcina alkanivorans TaxID=571177 RepID=A0A5K7YID3_9BACT|nr:16S rRNA (guanine(527)-N(7))-methyltransferase RsmG [Desulfosarcina alkanivorans]BBO66174.1 ribosomal RNA small subunit methyltransferase G [Desulfosarcina alkanivorans]